MENSSHSRNDAPHEEPDGAAPRRVIDVLHYIQQMIQDGELRPGDQLPTERDLARRLKMSRGSARIGIGYLSAIGIVEMRSGVGAFLSDGATQRRSPSLQLMGCVHHFGRAQAIEACSIVEEAAAELAAGRLIERRSIELAENLAEIYASVLSGEDFMSHEMRFLRLVAESSRNQVLVAVMDMIAAILFSSPKGALRTSEQRRAAADRHHEIYKAIRAGRRESPGRRRKSSSR